MTTTETPLPWRSSRWTPLEGGTAWQEGMRAEYVALVGTPRELADWFTGAQTTEYPLHTRPSGFVARSPHQHGRDLLAAEQEHRPDVAADLVALVWDVWPSYRWDGARNRPDDPDHLLAVITAPGGRDVRHPLLARFQAAHAEWQLRDAAISMWEQVRDVTAVHRVTGLARSTLYRHLRAAGHHPTGG